MVDGRSDGLVIDLKDGLIVVVVDEDDEDLLVDKCAKDDFVNFESVVVEWLLLLTPK